MILLIGTMMPRGWKSICARMHVPSPEGVKSSVRLICACLSSPMWTWRRGASNSVTRHCESDLNGGTPPYSRHVEPTAHGAVRRLHYPIRKLDPLPGSVWHRT